MFVDLEWYWYSQCEIHFRIRLSQGDFARWKRTVPSVGFYWKFVVDKPTVTSLESGRLLWTGRVFRVLVLNISHDIRFSKSQDFITVTNTMLPLSVISTPQSFGYLLGRRRKSCRTVYMQHQVSHFSADQFKLLRTKLGIRNLEANMDYCLIYAPSETRKGQWYSLEK